MAIRAPELLWLIELNKHTVESRNVRKVQCFVFTGVLEGQPKWSQPESPQLAAHWPSRSTHPKSAQLTRMLKTSPDAEGQFGRKSPLDTEEARKKHNEE